jgi:TetR/AcrR family transcriptional regulator, transcriptional repressor for nem operon
VAPPKARAGKRERLVEAARRLFHEQGVEKTTLAEIAVAADVPAGNVFYYFKTKDALVAAVVGTFGEAGARLGQVADGQPTPQARLKALIREWEEHRESLAAHGCPIGSLAYELSKRGDGAQSDAAAVLSGLIDWAAGQFAAMGRADARELAVALISAYEGIALLANVLQDPGLISAEGRRLEGWIDALAAGTAGAVPKAGTSPVPGGPN